MQIIQISKTVLIFSDDVKKLGVLLASADTHF